MKIFLIFPICLLTIQSCANPEPNRQTNDQNKKYFTDAVNCFNYSVHKQNINVTTGKSQTVVEVPLSHDAGAFTNCMAHAGYSVPRVEPKEYMETARRCLLEARGTETPDDVYSSCIKEGNIAVDVIIDKKDK